MKSPRLFDTTGKQLNLGERIGKGGEGEVFTLADKSDVAVKVYTVADIDSRRDKILAMIRGELARKSPLAAFPISIVQTEAGAFAGFIMSKVSAHEPLHELYSPAARKAAFPNADYRFLTRVASNLSRAIASVHAGGCIIGDINHSGVLVSSKATVMLIDADSFQIVDGAAQYLCKVGVPEYTPPELQGLRLDTVLRTTNHDNFGLAIAIFQLLWMGRHPFSGRYQGGDMPMERAIKELKFAYSAGRATGMSPPPAVPLLVDFPPSIRNAFESAFGPSGLTHRPTAPQWVNLLQDLEQGLQACKQNTLHHYPADARECPWCRMEKMQGVQLFMPPSRLGEAATVDATSNVAVLWAAIEKVVAPNDKDLKPYLPQLNLQPSAVVNECRKASWQKKLSGTIVCTAGIGLIANNPGLVIFGGALIVWGLILLFSGTSARTSLIAKARDVETSWLKALYEWEARCGSLEFTAYKNHLADMKRELQALPAKETQLITKYKQNRRGEQLRLYLEKFLIRQFRIKGIGPAKLATLTSYGIETADDIDEVAVMQVPGFGPVNAANLVEWKNKLIGRFAYDPNPNAQDQTIIGRIRADIQREAGQLRANLAQGPRELQRIAQAIEQRRCTSDPVLMKVYAQRMQVVADLTALNILMPAVVPPSRPAPPKVQQRAPVTSGSSTRPSPTPSRTSAPPSCPRCSGAMVLRQARHGRNSGNLFWGCSRYPGCTGTRNV